MLWSRTSCSGVPGREQEGVWDVGRSVLGLCGSQKVISNKCNRIAKGAIMTVCISHSAAGDILTKVETSNFIHLQSCGKS